MYGITLWQRPLLEHARPLTDCQPNPRPTFYFFSEQLTSLVEIVAGVEQAVDLHAVLGPLFELVEIAVVREERIVGLLVRPVRLLICHASDFMHRHRGFDRCQ